MQLKNVATVMVTAQLPAFAQPGQTIDVNVSSLANAKSLRGGTLIATPLKGADGQIYALAQGNLVVGGAGASAAGSKVQINHLSAGRIPDGATVERSVADAARRGRLDPARPPCERLRDRARSRPRDQRARWAAASPTRSTAASCACACRPSADARVAFMADIENLDIRQATPSAKVVINARTGSIVMNQAVTLAACAVAHGNLSVTISTTPTASQPEPFARAARPWSPRRPTSRSRSRPARWSRWRPARSSADVVKALNSLGATPQDLLAILQAMKSAGALNAELEVI